MAEKRAPRTIAPKRKPGKHRHRYDLFLNPYHDMAFTRCPKCENKSKLRKFPLVVHIEPDTMCVINKSCRLCPSCELLIVHQREIEPLMAEMVAARAPEVVGNDYLIIGTLERADWRTGNKGELSPADVAERAILFHGQLNFEVRGGWGPAEA